MNPIEDFRNAMLAAGLECKEEIRPDGERHRFNVPGEKGSASWYRIWQNGDFFNGCFGCWRRGLSAKWNSYNGSEMTPEQRRQLQQQIAEAKQESRTEEEKLRAEAKRRASQILSAAKPVSSHVYLIQKDVEAYGEIRLAEKDFIISDDWILPINRCLVLPLRTIDGALQTVEFIAPDKRFGRDGEKRNKQLLYGGDPKGAFFVVSERADGPLIICEGYATGATLYSCTGYATICARNAGNILPVAQTLRKKYPKRDFIIASDNDRFSTKAGEPYNAGLDYATKAAAAVKAALAVPDFSDSDDSSSDFNDLAEVSGTAQVKLTIEAAYKEFLMPKFTKLPPVVNARDLLAADMPLPEILVEGLLHRGLKAVLGSNSKARKSWILLDLGISVAAGVRFWKWDTRPGRVLYINFEIPQPFFRRRMDAVLQAKQLDASVLSNLDVWPLRGYGSALFKLLPDLIAQIKYGEYALVIIDPIYKALGGRDENAAGDISDLCNEIEKISVETGAAVIYGAHYSKGNQAAKEAIDRIGGSGVWTRDADTIITLTKHETEGAYTVDLILRNLPETEPFVVQWEYPLMKEAPELSPDDLKKPKAGRRRAYDTLNLLAAIVDNTIENPISISAWAEKANVKRQTLSAYLDEMRQKGWIQTVGDGSTARQCITERGLEAVRNAARD